MASNHAHMACVLKVDQRCDACKRHAMEVLGCIDGVFKVNFDAESKTVRIMGEVDPNYCIKALARCGVHAELVRADLTHPRYMTGAITRGLYDNNEYYDPYSHNNYYGIDPYASTYRRPITEGMWHERYHNYNQYPVRLPEYSYNSNRYYDGPSHVQSHLYPRATEYYSPYADEHPNMCTIM